MSEPTINTSIWLALKSRIDTIPTQINIIMPGNFPEEAPHDNGQMLPFLHVARVFSDPSPAFIEDGKPHTRTGALIVTLRHPITRAYTISRYDQIAGEVANHFVDGTMMRHGNVCVRVTSYPSINEGYEDNGYWVVPVSIPWRTFV